MRVLLANVSLWRGDPKVAIDFATEARAVFQEFGDPWGELQSVGPETLALNACLRTTEAKAMVDVADIIAAPGAGPFHATARNRAARGARGPGR